MIQLVAASPTLVPGTSETISVYVNPTATFTLTSADLDIQFDSTRFSVSNVQLGTLDSDTSVYTLVTNAPPPSNVLISSISETGNGTPTTVTASGTLETFTLTALANAPTGGGAIQFLASSGTSHTDVFETSAGGPLVLSPAPVNGVYNSIIDTTVTVSVPEPSSFLLMGLGGASIMLRSRFRKRAQRTAAV
jgi:hypothetical protein